MAVLRDRAITARNQNGIFDPGILCADCDGKMGTLDKWFMENFETLHKNAINSRAFEPIVVGVDALAALRFAVSVIYRASLSGLDHFNEISLGSYTTAAGEIAIGSNDADYGLPLVLMNVLTSDNLNMRQWAFYPVRCASDNGVYFIFTLSGVQFLVKFGGRHGGVSSDDRWSHLSRIRPGDSVTIYSYPFDESGEADFLRAAKRSDNKRQR